MNRYSQVVDVFAETGVPSLLNREVVFLSGSESRWGLFVTLIEDLTYRHNHEFGESVGDRIKV